MRPTHGNSWVLCPSCLSSFSLVPSLPHFPFPSFFMSGSLPLSARWDSRKIHAKLLSHSPICRLHVHFYYVVETLVSNSCSPFSIDPRGKLFAEFVWSGSFCPAQLRFVEYQRKGPLLQMGSFLTHEGSSCYCAHP